MDEYVCEVVERPAEAPIMILSRRERITRCRDCRRAYQRGDALYCSRYLRWGSNDRPAPLPVEPDGFCVWGEPREEC